MFPKKNRLSKKEIEEILLSGERIHSPHLLLVFKRTATQKNNRFAVVVSKKVSLLATERNKLKRRIRAIIQKLNNYKKDSIFFTKPKSVTLPHNILKQEIEYLLRK